MQRGLTGAGMLVSFVIDLSATAAAARLGVQPSESAMIDKIHEALGGPPYE
jgi:hypothetical protein